MTASCLADRLSNYLRLSELERAALARLEDQERAIRRGTVVRREHDPANELFIVRSGWMYSHVLMDDGSRQILRLHLPGDLVGASCVAFREATESLVALTDVALCPFETSALRDLFVQHPRIAALIFAMAQAERVALTDRLASLGRTSAKARVAALLVDTAGRLRAMLPDLGDSFVFPLTQEEIGDATGLTAVHVNRMMRALVEERLIARPGTQITILDEPRLKRVANYVDRYAGLNTSWLPNGE